MLMICVGVSSFLPPPICTAENEQWDVHVFHSASAAAIFMGWYFSSTTPSSLPTNMAKMMDGSNTASEMVAARRKVSLAASRRMCHADTPSMMTLAVTSAAKRTCGYAHTKVGFVNKAQMFVSCGWPWALVVYPTGCCIQELAAMMNAAERIV